MSASVLRGERVQLRPWADADLAPFAAMNADPEVMRHMSRALSRDESDAYAGRIRAHVDERGYGLWALDAPIDGELRFAGFVGLAPNVPFTIDLPGITPEPHEIGWRLTRRAWGHGYATEAARLVLRHGFAVLRLAQIVSFTALRNAASVAVMERIGLTRRGEFDHPRLAPDHPSHRHVLYAADAAPTITP